jgi:hypothetical protein
MKQGKSAGKRSLQEREVCRKEEKPAGKRRSPVQSNYYVMVQVCRKEEKSARRKGSLQERGEVCRKQGKSA